MAVAKKKSISLKENIQIVSKIESGVKQAHVCEQLSRFGKIGTL